MPTNRRQFMRVSAGSTAMLAAPLTAPQFFFDLNRQASVQAALGKQRSDNVLVVVQLSGGNDGLNTVVPYADDAYGRNRFTLRINSNQVHKLDDHVGLHPAMADLAELHKQGRFTVVQGVGYPNPNRSHFASMDIWHTARTDAPQDTNPARRTGWVGRYLDNTAKHNGVDVPALHLGADRQPLAVVGKDVRVPSVQNVDGFKLQTGGNALLQGAVQAAAEADRADGTNGNELLSFMQQSTVAALRSSNRVQQSLKQYKTTIEYPTTGLSKKLRTIAQLIDAGMSTRIYYVTLGGFDTHANQAQAHAGLLREYSGAVAAFLKDLKAHGHDERVLLLTFSEFGRRIKENGSRGTDHGVAAPVFLAGGKVRGGIIGKHPSLTETDQGDLKHHTDFRSVYAGVLEQWMKLDSAKVLGKSWQSLKLVKA